MRASTSNERGDLLARSGRTWVKLFRGAGIERRAASRSVRRPAESVPTLRAGAKWRPSSIQASLGYRRPGRRDRLPSLDRGEA